MNEKRPDLSTVIILGCLALCGYLVRCLVATTKETTASISSATSQITTESTRQMESLTKSYSTALIEVSSKVTGLAETLVLGRDSPRSSESLSMSETESQSSSEPEIDMSALPETARWASEAEDEVLKNEMPWQSSTLPGDLEPI